MSGVSGGVETLSQTIELKGHLIDSLTLSKVIDRIQQLGGDYQLNDIRIGSLKKDISAITMTLLAPNQALMQQLLESLTPYGIAQTETANATFTVCTQDGEAPENAYQIKHPHQLQHKGVLRPIQQGGTWVIVLENDSTQQPNAVLKPLHAVRKGDQLLQGTQGLHWQVTP